MKRLVHLFALWLSLALIAVLEWSKPPRPKLLQPTPKPPVGSGALPKPRPELCECIGCVAARRNPHDSLLLVLIRLDMLLGYALGTSLSPVSKDLVGENGRKN